MQFKVIGFVKFLWGLRGVVLTSSGKDIPCKKKLTGCQKSQSISANCKSFHAVWEWAIPSDTGIANCPSCLLRYPIKSQVSLCFTYQQSQPKKETHYIISCIYNRLPTFKFPFNIYHNAKEYPFIYFHFHSIFAALSPTF